MTIKWVQSPNYTVGREGKNIDRVVIHWIVGKLAAADAVFTKPGTSAHYAIGNTEVHQYVKEENTAYHAGNWEMNLRSIGIEHQGSPELPVSEDTIKTSIDLITDICKRYGIPADRSHIIKHSEVKATQCPGTVPIDRIVSEVNTRLKASGGATDTIPVPKGDFENLVRKSGEYDAVCDYFKFDSGSNQSGKIKDAVEKLKGDLQTCQATINEAADIPPQNPTDVVPEPTNGDSPTDTVGGNTAVSGGDNSTTVPTDNPSGGDSPEVVPQESQGFEFLAPFFHNTLEFIKSLWKKVIK